MARKKILIFSLAYYPDHVGGAEVAIKEITDRISPNEVTFSMVTHRFASTAPRREQVGNVTVYRVGFGPAYVSKILFVPLAALKAALLHRTERFDALWALMTYMLFPLVVAKFLGVRQPYLLTLQDGDPYESVFGRWFVLPFVPLLDWGIRHATAIQAISSYLATWPKKRGFRGDVSIVPNGASPASTKEYPPEELAALKQEVGVKEGEVLLVSVARLVHQKAIDVVLRALAILPKHIRYLIVGDGAEQGALEKLAHELGVSDRVVFVGHVDRTMTAKYRKISDIFVTPSRSEGQGISFLSAFAAGLPVIATQEGGIADFLFDAKRNPNRQTTGWAVDKDSPEQIAAAVGEILASPEEAQRVVAAAKQMVKEKYNWDTIAVDMRNVFDRVILRP